MTTTEEGGGRTHHYNEEEIEAEIEYHYNTMSGLVCFGCGKKFTDFPRDELMAHCRTCCSYKRLNDKCHGGCGNYISQSWASRPYGHRCVKCGFICIENIDKVLDVEDEEERRRVLRMDREREARIGGVGESLK